MNNLPADMSNRIMRFVSHPVADLFNHELEINNEYIPELKISDIRFLPRIFKFIQKLRK